MRKFEVELAICISYGSDSGPWHTETVEVEMDIPKDAENPTPYQFLEAAEHVYYDGDSHQDEDIVAIAFYAWSEIITCPHCGHEYNLTYDGDCLNPECPGIEGNEAEIVLP
jgi:nitrite reductase/ring-hydroxylating ferredoxin subunit